MREFEVRGSKESGIALAQNHPLNYDSSGTHNITTPGRAGGVSQDLHA
jgi:hypothetical protein